MEINSDFSRRAAAHSGEMPWQPSPKAGVERKMLDRIGGEVARATTIVRFAPGSAFSAHTHDGGEEFVVLEGVFEDEHGAYPAGYYIRNPPSTSHVPGSSEGCTILVKLWQFDPDDRHQMAVDMNRINATPDPDRAGVSVVLLHEDGRENVRREFWKPGAGVALDAPGGAEVFVLAGSFEEGGETFERFDWLRLPDGWRGTLAAGSEGADVWIKTGHLRHVRRPPEA
jgi:hypothetical protein